MHANRIPALIQMEQHGDVSVPGFTHWCAGKTVYPPALRYRGVLMYNTDPGPYAREGGTCATA